MTAYNLFAALSDDDKEVIDEYISNYAPLNSDNANYYNKKGFDEVAASFRREKSYNQDSLVVKHHNSKYKGICLYG